MTVKDSAEDNISLQTHSFTTGPQSTASLYCAPVSVSSPGFICRFEHYMLRQDLNTRNRSLLAIFLGHVMIMKFVVPIQKTEHLLGLACYLYSVTKLF